MIEVDHLTKRYGQTSAVDDLTFRVTPGHITGFLGPNGAGTTTTLKAILALIRPTSGATRVLGKHYRELDDPIRKVGAVVETSRYHPAARGGITSACWRRRQESRVSGSRKCSSWSR